MSATQPGELTFKISFKSPAAGTLTAPFVDLILEPRGELPSDYVQNIEREIHFLWQYCPFDNEEDLAELLLNYIFSETRLHGLSNFPFLSVGLKISHKTFHLDRRHFDPQPEKTKFGRVDTLFVNSEFGVYRLRIAPGLEIPQHTHHVMEEKEIILTSGLLLDGKAIPPGTVNVWPHGLAHRYQNPTQEEQCILCIDQPPFDAEDEVLV